MFLFYVLSCFKKGDIIQGGTLFKGGHYLRKYGIYYVFNGSCRISTITKRFQFFFRNKNFIARKQSLFWKSPPIKKEIQGKLHHKSKYITRLSEGGGGDCIPAFCSSVNPISFKGHIMFNTLLLPPGSFRCSYSPTLKDLYRAYLRVQRAFQCLFEWITK